MKDIKGRLYLSARKCPQQLTTFLIQLMAYNLNQQPPAALLSWRDFAPGDSNIISAKRNKAIQEVSQKLQSAIQDYNSANSLQVDNMQIGFDVDARQFTCSGAIPYKIVIDATTGDQSVEAVNYIADYAPWTVPTTGELKGVKSLYDAFIAILKQQNRLNDTIREDDLTKSAKPLVTLTNNESESRYDFAVQMPIVVDVDAATGVASYTLYDVGAIADLQNGVLV